MNTILWSLCNSFFVYLIILIKPELFSELSTIDFICCVFIIVINIIAIINESKNVYARLHVN